MYILYVCIFLEINYLMVENDQLTKDFDALICDENYDQKLLHAMEQKDVFKLMNLMNNDRCQIRTGLSFMVTSFVVLHMNDLLENIKQLLWDVLKNVKNVEIYGNDFWSIVNAAHGHNIIGKDLKDALDKVKIVRNDMIHKPSMRYWHKVRKVESSLIKVQDFFDEGIVQYHNNCLNLNQLENK